jgi:hypothetical protein
MPEWWTYTLSDLQSFSLATYHRLFDRYNAAIWPGQIVAVALGAAIGAFLRRGADARRGRLIAGILAACWLWIAFAFHANRYTTIHWGAVYFAGAFGLEALLLVWAGILRGRLTFDRRGDAVGQAGLAIFLFALLVQPLIGLLFGRGWRQIEVFGIAPDPTAVGTLGILLLTAGRARWELIAVPVLWCALSGATLLAMGTPAGWVMLAAAVLAVLGSTLKS